MGGLMSKSSSSTSRSSAPSKPKVQITDVDRAILDLKNARDRLQRYRKKLEIDDAKLLMQAQKAKSVNQTSTALNLLRLRKFKKNQLEACEEQLLNVFQLVETIDSKRNDKAILDAMAVGRDQLKKLHEEHTVDDILNLMDSISEEVMLEQEINTILSNNNAILSASLSPQQEDEIEAELQAMMNSTTTSTVHKQQEFPTVPTEPILPTAPNQPLPEQQTPPTTTEQEQRIAVPG